MFNILYVYYETVCTYMSCNLRRKLKESWMTFIAVYERECAFDLKPLVNAE